MRLQEMALAGLVLLAGCDSRPPAAPANASVEFHGNADEMIVPVANVATGNAMEAGEVSPAINLAPDGLSLMLASGAARHATFGLARADATRMVGAALGDPIEQGDNQDCGAGALGFAHFRGGLTLYFEGAEFAGWDLDGRDGASFSTANGVAIGTTRKALEAAGPVRIEESSIGIEFAMGDLSGLLDSSGADARVTNLWAGVTCIAR